MIFRSLPGAATRGRGDDAIRAGLRPPPCPPSKFFPARRLSGGAPGAEGQSGAPIPQVALLPPTGGVSLANAGSYLSLPNVLCAGLVGLHPHPPWRRATGPRWRVWRARPRRCRAAEWRRQPAAARVNGQNDRPAPRGLSTGLDETRHSGRVRATRT